MFTFMALALTVAVLGVSVAKVVNAVADKNTAVNAVANAVLIEVFISLILISFLIFGYKTTPFQKRFSKNRAFIPG